MTINLTVPQTMQELRPRITVVGVGGGGCNAVNNMINADLEGVDFLVLNTDGQALAHSKSSRKIQLGSAVTQGLGAGSKPEIGRAAAEESLAEVMSELADCNMVFITAGMGGGTGTGAAPVIARAARERGILTVGVVTKPFEFEGQRRMKQAEDGIEELQAYVDTLIVIPNQNLFRLANERTTFADAFHMADTVLHQGVCGVTDLMIKPGQINLDFADIRAVMGEMGKAMMGTGEASGESRATQAAEAAINNPLLDDTTMKGANAVLINITGGLDMTLFEVDEAANRIRKEVDPDATIIFGSAFDDKLDGIMRVSVVATGINNQAQSQPRPAAAPIAAATSARPQTSTILPNPLAGFMATASQPAMAETAPDAGAAPAAAMISKADNPEVTPAPSGDVATVISNEIAGDAIEAALATVETDDDRQLDVAEAIAATTGATTGATTATATADSTPANPAPESTAQTATADLPMVGDAPNLPLTAATDRRGETRPAFIPDAPAPLPEEETVATTDAAPAQRPTSLINKISGLWSSKPTSNKPAPTQRSEPAIDEATNKEQIAISILDLSRPGDAAGPIGKPTGAPLESSEDDLDIPAFLRRQAN